MINRILTVMYWLLLVLVVFTTVPVFVVTPIYWIITGKTLFAVYIDYMFDFIENKLHDLETK